MITEEPYYFIFDGYLALGMIHEIIGDPETVKTTTVLDWCARITTGTGFPDPAKPLIGPAPVMYLSGEDPAKNTLKPRLRIAGANVEMVRIIPSDFIVTGESGEQILTPLVIPDHLQRIEDQIIADGTKLFVADPLESFFPDRVNTHNNAGTRKVLAALAAMAERTNCAVLSVRHLNKMSSEEKALYRGGASIAFAGASRCTMAMGRDPTEHGMPDDHPMRRHILAIVKTNFGPHQPSRALRKVVDKSTVDDDHPHGIVHVEWLAGTVPVTANDLMRAQHKRRNPEAMNEAVEFLRDELAEGPKLTVEVEEHARVLGISKSTLKRARKKAKVISAQDPLFSGPWYLSLPTGDADEQTGKEVYPNGS